MTSANGLRKKLLNNGYTPIASFIEKNKKTGRLERKPTFSGWTELEVDSEIVDHWSTNPRLEGTSTCVRATCPDGRRLIFIDVDYDHPNAKAVVKAIEDELGSTILRGRPNSNKCALVYRYESNVDRKISSIVQTLKDNSKFRVDFLGGKKSEKLTCYGTHISSTQDNPIHYTWRDDKSLLDVPYDELPLVTEQKLGELRYEKLPQALAPYVKLPSYESVKIDTSNKAPGKTILNWDTEFEILEPDGISGHQTVKEIFEWLKANAGFVRCNLTGIRPNSDSGAGVWFLSKDGTTPLLYDHTEGKTYALKDPHMPEDSEAAAMLEWYVNIGGTLAADIRHPHRAPIQHKALSGIYGNKAVNDWKQNCLNKGYNCTNVVFDPTREPGPFFNKEYGNLFNTYVKYDHPEAESGYLAKLLEALKELVPCPVDRYQCMAWLQNLVVNPGRRKYILWQVGPFGTGKGSFADLASRCIGGVDGRHYVRREMADILGAKKTGWNADLMEALLVYVGESRGCGSLQKAREAYETVKDLFDDRPIRMARKKKFCDDVQVTFWAHALFSSNEDVGLAIPYNDRRVVLVSFPNRIAPGGEFHKLVNNEEAIAGITEELHTFNLKEYADAMGIEEPKGNWTPYRDVILGSAETPVETFLKDCKRDWLSDVCTMEQLIDQFVNTASPMLLLPYEKPQGGYDKSKIVRMLEPMIRRTFRMSINPVIVRSVQDADRVYSERVIVLRNQDRWCRRDTDMYQLTAEQVKGYHGVAKYIDKEAIPPVPPPPEPKYRNPADNIPEGEDRMPFDIPSDKNGVPWYKIDNMMELVHVLEPDDIKAIRPGEPTYDKKGNLVSDRLPKGLKMHDWKERPTQEVIDARREQVVAPHPYEGIPQGDISKYQAEHGMYASNKERIPWLHAYKITPDMDAATMRVCATYIRALCTSCFRDDDMAFTIYYNSPEYDVSTLENDEEILAKIRAMHEEEIDG